MEKIKTHIPNLDDALEGGIPKKNIVLLAGSAGTGKTTLAMEMLFRSASQNEKVIYFGLSEPEFKIIQNFKEFKFFDEKAINNGNLIVLDIRTMSEHTQRKTTLNPDKILDFISEHIVQNKPAKIVIDSISAICKHFEEDKYIRSFIYNLGNILIAKNCTAFLISETEPGVRKYSNFGVEEFMVDGIIFNRHIERNFDLKKSLQIVKMRGTNHSTNQFLLHITNSGIQLLKSMENKNE